MATVNATQWNTTTTGTWYEQDFYYATYTGGYVQPAVRRTVVVMSKAARARMNLLVARGPTPAPVAELPAAARHVVETRAHRRTVVPRGTVSWIRAGTRRPL